MLTFRNHYNMLVCCLIQISYYYQCKKLNRKFGHSFDEGPVLTINYDFCLNKLLITAY